MPVSTFKTKPDFNIVSFNSFARFALYKDCGMKLFLMQLQCFAKEKAFLFIFVSIKCKSPSVTNLEIYCIRNNARNISVLGDLWHLPVFSIFCTFIYKILGNWLK